jgi:hypothetical protein
MRIKISNPRAKVPLGVYEAFVTRSRLRIGKDGQPRLCVEYTIKNGDYKGLKITQEAPYTKENEAPHAHK